MDKKGFNISALISVIVVLVLFGGGMYLFRGFYLWEDLDEGDNTIGKMDLEETEDSIEDIEEDMEELTETISDQYDWNVLMYILLSFTGIIILFLFAYFFIK